MNTDTFTYLLANPQSIDKEHLSDLASVIDAYPWFQSARALQLKGLKNENSFLYNDALKVTAAHTIDRDILFEYITSEHFVQDDISEHIIQHDESVMAIEIEPEDLSEQVSKEIDQQIKVELKKAEAILDPELFERKEESVHQLVEQEEVIEVVAREPVVETPIEEAPEESTPEEPSPEETLELDKPITFTKDDTYSFGEWLKLTQAKPIEREVEETPSEAPQSDRERKFELIDKFIQEKPKIDPGKIVLKKVENKNLAKPFTKSSEALMTETLAKVYLQQKNYKKAIQAYKILILKNPEKSGFFADQIRAIKKLINSEES